MGGKLRLNGVETEYNFEEDLFAEVETCNEEAFDCIDELAKTLAESKLDFDSATLLLSEGKDSTGIALALAEINVKIDCVTFANSDTNIGYVEFLAKRTRS